MDAIIAPHESDLASYVRRTNDQLKAGQLVKKPVLRPVLRICFTVGYGPCSRLPRILLPVPIPRSAKLKFLGQAPLCRSLVLGERLFQGVQTAYRCLALLRTFDY